MNTFTLQLSLVTMLAYRSQYGSVNLTAITKVLQSYVSVMMKNGQYTG